MLYSYTKEFSEVYDRIKVFVFLPNLSHFIYVLLK